MHRDVDDIEKKICKGHIALYPVNIVDIELTCLHRSSPFLFTSTRDLWLGLQYINGICKDFKRAGWS